MDVAGTKRVYGESWAVVLAGGDGSRLRDLTRDARGRSVPKQFCSLRGGRTLLEDALARARALTDPGRILVVVRRDHRSFWESTLATLPEQNILIQPENRGTGLGILLSMLDLFERDPEARVVVLPSDHHVRNESVLEVALLTALRESRRAHDVTLLGMIPDAPETEYGWIVPGRGHGQFRHVDTFVEKPDRAVALAMLTHGAVWNSFLLVGQVRAFLELFERRQPDLLSAFAGLRTFSDPNLVRRLEPIYGGLPTSDFSRDVLQGVEDRLSVLLVPPCGWTDLGTPGRIAACLREGVRTPVGESAPAPCVRLDLALAAQRSHPD